MALYHPPRTITTNAAPAIAADLAYENHGKCGNTRILRSTDVLADRIFDSVNEGTVNAWKMVVLSVGTAAPNQACRCVYAGALSEFRANNMSIQDCDKMVGVNFAENFEIMGDITRVELDRRSRGMVVVLYMDCTQS